MFRIFQWLRDHCNDDKKIIPLCKLNKSMKKFEKVKVCHFCLKESMKIY